MERGWSTGRLTDAGVMLSDVQPVATAGTVEASPRVPALAVRALARELLLAFIDV